MFILRSHWLIIRKFDVHPSNSFQDIRQNHGTMKIRSSWPSHHNIQVNVIRSSVVWPTISINCLHNKKAENHFLKVSYILASNPTLGHGPWGQESWKKSLPSRVPTFQIWIFSVQWLPRYELLKNLHLKLTQCDADANTDNRGDYNNSPWTSYRRAKNEQRPKQYNKGMKIVIWIWK